ncbi:MAG: VWA domain-containing protein [Planctomycetes bacterium]|nr:VWA domain-containing protein [Planctomycetota bacterium]
MSHFQLNEAWMLLLLPLALAAFWRLWRRRSQPAMTFSVVARAKAAGAGYAARLRWLPSALRALVLGLLVLCIARPVRINEQTSTLTDGVAIELVVDRSSSMLALDFTRNGKPIDRLNALKDVVERFVDGGANLPGRKDDLVGLVTFARFADSISPLTMDHEWLLAGLKDIKPADPAIGDDGTAIGDAVALGAEKLRDATEGKNRNGAARIKSKVLVLLTDGENNAGDIEPMTAAELCKSLGIRLYTIGMGTRGIAMMPVQTPFGTQMARQPVSIDEGLLTKMATATGGQYFRATDTKSLEQIYQRIDELEKTVTEQKRTILAKDLAVEGFRLGGISWPSLLTLAMLLLAVELFLSHTRLRTLP